MSILKNLISLVHHEDLKLFKTYDFSLEEIEHSAHSPDNNITALFFDSLEIEFNLASTDQIAHVEHFRDDLLE